MYVCTTTILTMVGYVSLFKQKKPSLYVYHRDMMPGSIKHEERLTAIRKSRKVIVILSNSYVTSSECQGEANIAGKIFISDVTPVTVYKMETLPSRDHSTLPSMGHIFQIHIS